MFNSVKDRQEEIQQQLIEQRRNLNQLLTSEQSLLKEQTAAEAGTGKAITWIVAGIIIIILAFVIIAVIRKKRK